MDQDVDYVTVTITAELGEQKITKEMTVSKSKQGAKGSEALTYILTVSPDSWNKTAIAEITPAFTVIKYVGETATDITIDGTNCKIQSRDVGSASG
jgi:hypothetical protein